MKAASFDYVKPATLVETLRALARSDGQAKLMAGSQSLGPMLNLRLARPAQVVDVSRLDELRTVELIEGRVRVGASVTHAEIEDGCFELLRGHPVQEMAARIAYRSVRNRGTVGGSLAHADPAADWILAARALNALVEVRAFEQAPRLIKMQDFMLAAYTTSLAEGEVITALHLPRLSAQARWGYYKFCRKTGEFAEASCAVYFEPASATAQIVVGALDSAPVALETLASEVARGGLAVASEAAIEAALKGAIEQLDTLGRRMAGAAIARCLAQAFGVHA
ncbi:MAG: FAD binding domain-containing protein [Alcaligenaceae bacterium]|nr:FAD binding domain-containing protein [Alcaligenaceae bacterium]